MDEKYGNLLEILEKEVDLYGEFLNLLRMERQYMVDLSSDKLHECSNHRETIILNLQILEESRKDLIALMLNGHQFGTPTLAIIIEGAPTRYKKGLEMCRSNLLSLVNSIREINQVNGILAERVINYTRNSLSFLNRLAHDLSVYHSSDRMEQEKKTSRLIYKKG